MSRRSNIFVSGGASPPALGRPAIDANHTHVWYLGSGCSPNGTTITADVGGVNLTRSAGSGTATTGFSCFSTQQSLLINDTSEALTTFSGAVSISTSQACTVEGILMVDTLALERIVSVQNWLQVWFNTGSGQINGFFFRYRNTTNAEIASSRWDGAISQVFTATRVIGSGLNQVVMATTNHYMLSWNPATPRIDMYINGVNIGNTTSSTFAGNRSATLDQILIYPWCPNASMADIRISNIARPQSYAIAATQAMLSL